MKCFFGALAILAVLSSLTAAASLEEPMPRANSRPKEPMVTRDTVPERWIKQKLDNFDDDNNATWSEVRIRSFWGNPRLYQLVSLPAHPDQ